MPQASSATIDRLSKYDGMIRNSAACSASHFSSSLTKPRWRIRGCTGTGSTGVPTSTSVTAAGRDFAVALPEVEQLGAALVLVDAADVDRRPAVDPGALAEALGAGIGRHLRPDADDDARHVVASGHRLQQRPLLRRVVHAGAHAAQDRLEDLQPEHLVALGRGHEDRLVGHRPRAVIRVVVAQAEEEHVVVARLVAGQVLHQRRTGRAFGVEPRQLVVDRVLRLEDALRPRAEVVRGSRAWDTGKRRTSTAPSRLMPAGYSFAQEM